MKIFKSIKKANKYHYSNQVKMYVLCEHPDSSYYFIRKSLRFELPNTILKENSDPIEEAKEILKRIGVESENIKPFIDFFDEFELKNRNVVYYAKDIKYLETKSELIQRKTKTQIKNELVQGLFKDSHQITILGTLIIQQTNQLYDEEMDMKKLKLSLFNLSIGLIGGMVFYFILDYSVKK